MQQKLLKDVLEPLLEEDEYLITPYSTTTVGEWANKSDHRVRVSRLVDADFTFDKAAESIAQSIRNTIITDTTNMKVETKSSLLQLIEQHISENIVKVCNFNGFVTLLELNELTNGG